MPSILAFLGTAYGLSIALSLVIWLTGGHDSKLIGLGYLSMFLPAISVLVVRSGMNEGLRLDWQRFPLKWIPVALFLIPGVLHAVMIPCAALLYGGVYWQGWLKPEADGLFHTPESRGWGTVGMPGLVAHIVLNAVAGLAVVSFLALFEEIGWRAWLLPGFRDRMGPGGAVVATAAIWALWHVPFQLSGISHIEGVSPMKLALTVPAGIFASGLILGWLWLRTESIWLASIAHGALNNWGQYAFKYMRDFSSPARELAILNAGSLGLLVVGALLLWRDAGRQKVPKPV